jgi:IclR family transcriptional regulator, KDG regulon repressor
MKRAPSRQDPGVRSGDTTLLVLETVAFAEDELGVTQISSRLGLTKSAIYRHLQGLVERGYLVQHSVTARYSLGPKAYLIGRLAPAIGDVAVAGDGPMREVRDRFGLSVVLTTPATTGALVVKTVTGTTSIAIGARVGSELAAHASAQGQVMLAFGSRSLVDRTLADPLPALTPHSITDPASLKKRIAKVRVDGFALAPEESILGINGLAAPVFNLRGDLAAAVAIVSSIQFLTAKPEPAMIDAVLAMARAISAQLGYGYASADMPRRPLAQSST